MKKILLAFLLLPLLANAQIITTIAGNGINAETGDGGLAVNASFYSCYGVCFDNHGNLLICDYQGYKVRKLDTLSDIITLFASDSLGGTSLGDDSLAIYAYVAPFCIYVDDTGNTYIGDEQLSSVRVRKVNAATGIITTIAGTSTVGYGGDGGPATNASFSNAAALCIDTSGNLYISDTWNHRIRKVNLATGIITTYAGTGTPGYSGDGGPATSAKISESDGICLDRSGNLYLSDRANGRIREVNAVTGIITTFAGNGIVGYGGDGGNADSAEFNYLLSMTFDSSGNLFFTDANNNRIRRIDAITHIITTVAGDGPECPPPGGCGAFGGDGGPADSGHLHTPIGLCLDHSGNIYIGDGQNLRVRKVGYGVIMPTFVGGAIQPLNLCIGASATSINSIMAITDVSHGLTEHWVVSSAPLHGTLGGFSATGVSTGSIVTPSGLTYTPATGFTGTDAFIIQISNGQDSTITTVNVTVNPMPSAITGTTTICIDVSTTLNASPAGGVWSSSVVPIAPVVYATGVVTGVTAGASIITYTTAPGCISTTYVTVDSLPLPITGTLNVCSGLTAQLIDSSFIGTWSSGNTGIATIDSLTGIVTGGSSFGIVTITYTLPTGCVITNNVTVDPLPYTILGTDSVCAGLTTTLTDFGGGVWSSNDAFVATIDSATGLVTGISPGTSTITYTDTSTGCMITTVFTVSPCYTEVPQIANGQNITIFPNPATTQLTIQSTDQLITQIAITNLLSQTIFQQTAPANLPTGQAGCKLLQVDVSGIPPGIYFVKINGTEVRKFVKE